MVQRRPPGAVGVGSMMEEIIYDLGVFALKVLLILNAGAALVLFVMMGVTHGPDSVIAGDDFRQVMFLFLAGIFFAMLAVATTYCLAQAMAAQSKVISHLAPLTFVAMMVVPAVASFLAFILGAAFAVFGMA